MQKNSADYSPPTDFIRFNSISKDNNIYNNRIKKVVKETDFKYKVNIKRSNLLPPFIDVIHNLSKPCLPAVSSFRQARERQKYKIRKILNKKSISALISKIAKDQKMKMNFDYNVLNNFLKKNSFNLLSEHDTNIIINRLFDDLITNNIENLFNKYPKIKCRT